MRQVWKYPIQKIEVIRVDTERILMINAIEILV